MPAFAAGLHDNEAVSVSTFVAISLLDKVIPIQIWWHGVLQCNSAMLLDQMKHPIKTQAAW